MNSPDEQSLDDLIGSTDPTRDDAPPPWGSDRYRSILENAMTTDSPPDTNGSSRDDHEAVPIEPGHSSDRPGTPRWLLGVAAAALVLAVVGGVVALGSRDGSEPADVQITTTTVLGQITSLRAEAVTTSDDGTRTSSIEVDGDDSSFTNRGDYADGHSETATAVRVDGVEYETIDGETTRREIPPEQRAAPFGSSSASIVEALRTNSTELTQTDAVVDGVPVTRVELEVTPATVDALLALSPGVLGWFGLEYGGQQVEQLTLWVDDRVIRQIEVVTATGGDDPPKLATTRTRFFGFNDDISITAPPGPYVDVAEG